MAKDKNFSKDDLEKVAGGTATRNSDGHATVEQYRARGIELVVNFIMPNTYRDMRNKLRKLTAQEARILYDERLRKHNRHHRRF